MADNAIPPEVAWTIVLDNMGLVHKIVREYCLNPSDRDDLTQEGMLGLLEAARRFEPSRQVAFSTYAYAWIRNRVLGYFQARREVQEIPPTHTLTDEYEDFVETGEPMLESYELAYIRQDLQKHLLEHLNNDLDEIERLVVMLYWFSPNPMTLDEIAKALGLRSHAAVNPIIQLALSKLRQGLNKRRQK